jgi:myo-inositol-1-phosphate synthase
VRTGIWLICARGSVATTATVGSLALRAGLVEPVGCVTELPPLRDAALPAWPDLVIGGHDIVATLMLKKAETLAAEGILPGRLITVLTDELLAHEDRVRMVPTAATQAETAERMAADLTAFADRHRLERVVVVNVSTTEPAASPHPAHGDLDTLRTALAGNEPVLPASSLAAYAAFTAGCAFVDFTPSTGARLPALAHLAEQQRLPFGGNDGKTGETLVKSVLAPMFAMRNLRVHSWSGLNLLGGGDGANLADPAANAAKVGSKQRVLGDALGYVPQGTTRIDHVEDVGDFKTAWDLIGFSGFLGTRMRMEFSWHGCDSALAAPLVLDLARITAAAHAAGHVGALTELGFFFKDPLGDGPAALGGQWTALTTFVAGLGERR